MPYVPPPSLPLSGSPPDMTGPINAALGSSSAPSYAFTGHTGSGLFYDATNLGIGFDWNAAQIGFLGVSAAGTTQFSLFGNSTTNNQIATYNNSAAIAPTFTLRRGHGTIAAPVLPVTGDQIGRVSFQPLTAVTPSFTNSLQIQGILTETSTVNSTHVGSQYQFLACPIGSGTLTEVARLDNENGLSMFGANPVIDQRRLHVFRPFTVATLPTGVNAYSKAFVTDATLPITTGLGLPPTGSGTNKVPVYTTDGTNWVIG